MSIIAQFENRGDRLSLVDFPTGGYYNLGPDFAPPTQYEDIIYSRAVDWGDQVVGKQEKNDQWAFSLMIKGETEADVKFAERQVQTFLNRAGNEADPLTLAWRPWASYSFEPIHGTFAKFARYEIVRGWISLPKNYKTLVGPGKFVKAEIKLVSKPMSLQRILAGFGAGGLVEDIYKAANGKSRGLRISPGKTNYVTNPIFEYPNDYSNGWSAGSGIFAAQNTDERFTLFGRSSVVLVYDGTTADSTAAMFRIQATVGSAVNCIFSFFVKKQDGSEVDESKIWIVKGTTPTTCVKDYVGDGWYRLWAVVTSSAGATYHGIQLVNAGDYFYFDGFDLSPGTMPSHIAHGDQVGSIWNGTPHNSTSTRGSTYYLRFPRVNLIPSYSEVTVRLVWRPETDLLDTRDFVIFDENNLKIYYSQANTRFEMTDGTNTINTTGMTVDGETSIAIHGVWDINAGMVLYLNGQSAASGGTYSIPAVASGSTYVYLGTDYGGSSNPALGWFAAFGVYGRAMTAAQVLDEYNQMLPLITNEAKIDNIPWVFTFNGGGVLYNQNDTAQGNYAVVGGFSGDVITPEIIATCSADLFTIGGIHLGQIAIDQRDFSQYIPGVENSLYSLLFRDESGSADVGNTSGDAYQNRTINTSATQFSTLPSFFSRQNTYFAGKSIRILGRIRDAGGGGSANLRVALRYYFGTVTLDEQFANLPALGTSNYCIVEYGEAKFPPPVRVRQEFAQTDYMFVVPLVKRTTGSSALYSDFIAYLPDSLELVYDGSDAHYMFSLKGKDARAVVGSWTVGQGEIYRLDPFSFRGYPLQFSGDKLNIINMVLGRVNDTTGHALVTWTMTINEMWLTIRNQVG